MSNGDLENRVSALEARFDAVEATVAINRHDASAARHLAAAQDRDLSDLTVRVDGIRRTLDALGQQTAERFTLVNERFDAMDSRFDAMGARLDAMDSRFDTIDSRLDTIDSRLDTMGAQMEAGFADVRGALAVLTTLVTRALNGGDSDR